MNNQMIELSNVDFSYGSHKLYSDINLGIGRGKMTCIMGNNGCGKTTLLKLICGLLQVDNGSVLVDGISIDKFKPQELAKKISYVPQAVNLSLELLVKDYLVLGRAPYIKWYRSPSKEDYAFAEEQAERVGVADLLGKRFNELSGGQKQASAIAKALVQDTPIIIMDEPMSALDLGRQADILMLLSKLQEKGKTVIFTTHNPNHALQIGCEVCLINAGEIIGYGGAEEVLNKHNITTVYGNYVEPVGIEGRTNVIFKLNETTEGTRQAHL